LAAEPTLPNFTLQRADKWLPKFYKPKLLDNFVAHVRLRKAYRVLKKQGCRRIILYIWRPDFDEALDLVDYDLSCFHIDDEYSFSTVEKPLDDREANLIKRVDQVFIHSPGLLDKKGHLNPNTLWIPNGVDFDRYAAPASEPSDLAAIPHPRMGYVGMIQTTVDFQLLSTIADQRSDWSFVFVGPRWTLTEEDEYWIQSLSQKPNCYFLGGKPVEVLPAYTQHFDVCMMPYKRNGYTNLIYPLKLHEYLASGRPAVGTPIRSLQDYSHLIELAATCDQWHHALAKALDANESCQDRLDARRSAARQHDWNNIVQRIANSMCTGLDTYPVSFNSRLAYTR